jgi:hypothetical protein
VAAAVTYRPRHKARPRYGRAVLIVLACTVWFMFVAVLTFAALLEWA